MERTRNIDVALIYQLCEARAAAANAGDVESWIALWYDGAVQMPPGQSRLQGKGRILDAFVARVNQPFRGELFIQPEEVRVWGGAACVHGIFECRTASSVGGKCSISRGKFLDILEKQVDGSWKITLDCFNYDGESE